MKMQLPSLQWKVMTGAALRPAEYRAEGSNEVQGHLYFWKISTSQLVELFPELSNILVDDVILAKVGYAKAARKNGNYYQIGAVHRTRECVRAWEKMLGLPAGTLVARLYCMEVHNVNEALAAEQYFHGRNQGTDIHALSWIMEQARKNGAEAPAGKTEFYFANIRSLYAKFLNCQRRENMAIGWEQMRAMNFRGPSGWSLPVRGTPATLEA